MGYLHIENLDRPKGQREASGEIVESKEAERAIKRRAVALFQARLKGSAA